MPSLIFNQGQALPYIFVFTDTQGDSDLAGGISLVYGLMYEMDNYECKLLCIIVELFASATRITMFGINGL